MAKTVIPPYELMMNPVIQALRSLGGSGTIEEINNKVTSVRDKTAISVMN